MLNVSDQDFKVPIIDTWKELKKNYSTNWRTTGTKECIENLKSKMGTLNNQTVIQKLKSTIEIKK